MVRGLLAGWLILFGSGCGQPPAALATAAILYETPANANPYFAESIWASPIYDKTICTGSNIDIISTSDLQQGSSFAPDTFLVVKGHGHPAVYNDDVNSTELRSSVVAESVDGCYDVIVFASHWMAAGTADIYTYTQGLIDNDIWFGGTALLLRGIQSNAYSIHTVHRPGSDTSSRTDLYLFDYNTWELLDYDDQAGAGQQATIYQQYLTPERWVLVASDSKSTEGYTDLVINDCVIDPDRATGPCPSIYDQDGDFLADSLEDELGTNKYDFNTDDDALFDYYEVIGRFQGTQTNYISQGFSGMGANPRRRDIFLEIDRKDSEPGHTEGAMLDVQAVYNDLPGIINHDGSIGVSFHADIGQPCPGNPSLCGDWGGVDTGLQYGNLNEPSLKQYVLDPTYALIKQDGHFFEMRWGIFHYVYLVGAPYGGGQANTVPGSSFFVADNGDCTIAHELGHDLGLAHWGDRNTALSLAMNKKASYPSLMNYSYLCTRPGNLDYSRFSEGKMADIDHTSIQESNYSPGAGASDLEYLHGFPLYFDFGSNNHQVDFNHDDRIGTPGNLNGLITFDVSPVYRTDEQDGNGVSGRGWPERYQRTLVESGVPSGGSGIAVESGAIATAWTFTPYEDPDPPGVSGDAFIRVRKVVFNGAKTWDGVGLLRGYPYVLAEDAETAAVWAPSGTAEIVVLHPEEGGDEILYYLLDTANPTAETTHPWQRIPNMPSGVRVRSISVTKFGVSSVLAVFRDLNAPDNEPNVYISVFGLFGGTWSTPTLLQGVVSYFTPGIATAQDGSLYIAIADIAGQGASGDILFYRKESGSFGDGTGWVRDSSLGFVRSGLITLLDDANPVKHRINLLSVPYMDHNRQPFSDGSAYLAVFWNVDRQVAGSPDDWFARRAYTTGYFLPLSDAERWSPEGWRSHRFTARPFPGHSVAVAAIGGNVMQLFTATSDWNADPNAEVPVADGLWFAPYVSGMPPVNTGRHDDNNDNADIKQYLCESSWRLVYGDDAECYCEYGADQSLWTDCGSIASGMTEPCP